MQGPGEAGFPVNLTLDELSNLKKTTSRVFPDCFYIPHPDLLAVNLDEERRAAKWL